METHIRMTDKEPEEHLSALLLFILHPNYDTLVLLLDPPIDLP